MHDDEVPIPDELARGLVDEQFPQWSGLPLRRLPPTGTDNQHFRLGEELLVRLPRIHWAADAPAREFRWLPRLAPLLPVDIPAPLALGEPGLGYPYQWSVVPFLRGENVQGDHLGGVENADWEALARDVGAFLVALRGIDAAGAPLKTGSERGGSLAACDQGVRETIVRAGDRVDGGAVLAAWEESLAAPSWDRAPAWLHGDIHEGNLLVHERRLSAVIDWGVFGAGDPAIELTSAWGFWPTHVIGLFREAMQLDDAAWLRGRGWAIVPAINGLIYYETSAPRLARLARMTIEQVCASV